ncbi:MAG: hypothetical protein H8D56_12725 [Planctomycetes bacterium]|nr:hypothetical protein [Planctomycetota bacterium]MBL7143851.1 hypothetical protein [Phycisphaerae bacterium]
MPSTSMFLGYIKALHCLCNLFISVRFIFPLTFLRRKKIGCVPNGAGPLREIPHIGYRVENAEAITEAAQGMKVLLEPFDAGFAVAGFYQTPDGAVVEFVTYKDGPSP